MAHYILVIVAIIVPFAVFQYLSSDIKIAGDTKYPMAICFVPEMQYIPEIDSWNPNDNEIQVNNEQKDALLADWAKKRQWCSEQIDPTMVKALSRWGVESMTTYDKVAAFADNMSFTAVSEYKEHCKIVFLGVIEELPSHSPIVQRNLILYLLYDSRSKEIIRATVTIRGEASE